MGTGAVEEASVSLDDVNTCDPDEASKTDLVFEASPTGDMSVDLESTGEILARVELDLSCVSEKLLNLSVLMMRLATKENDINSLKRENSVASAEKALEVDLLSRILDSEVTELDKLMMTIQADILEVDGVISTNELSGEIFVTMEEKLHDSVKSLKQSQDQVSEIRAQSAEFQRLLLFLDGTENWNGEEESKFLEDEEFPDVNVKIRMQTVEQQRHILKMLEESLAKELDLDKKLSESRQIEEELKRRLHSLQQELFFTEEETMDVHEKVFRAENASEILMGISKEALSRLQVIQVNLNRSIQRERKLRSKLKRSKEELEAKEHSLQKFNSTSVKLNEFLVAQSDSLKAKLTEAEDKLIIANSEAFTLTEKVSSLEKQLKEYEFQLLIAKLSADGRQEQENASFLHRMSEMEGVMHDLKEKICNAKDRAENAEAKCKLLSETNMEITEELGQLKGVYQKADLLERQLRKGDIRLQHAMATSEASQEKQNMLVSTVRDMENLIVDLRFKVSKAESWAGSTEDKCIMLSELNAELSEELVLLRSRLQRMESSLNQAEKSKMATARDIGFRTKVITDLVMQLALQRERIHKQISSLRQVNKALAMKLHQTQNDSPAVVNHHNDKVPQIPATDQELVKTQRNEFAGETEVPSADSARESRSLGRIDAGVVNRKHVSIAILALLISAAAYFCQPLNTAT